VPKDLLLPSDDRPLSQNITPRPAPQVRPTNPIWHHTLAPANDRLRGTPLTQAHGKSPAFSLLRPQPLAQYLLSARDYRILHAYCYEGVPADCGPDWPLSTVETALAVGPHVSAQTPDNVRLIWDDVQYQADAGFIKIVPLDQLRARGFPSNTKVSRLAVVPQTDRRGRLILNLSAPVHSSGPSRRSRGPKLPLQASVNSTTVAAPERSGVEHLGQVLPGLLQYMFDAPQEWTIHWSKLDLSDGFWRMVVQGGLEPNFLYVLPTRQPSEPIHVVLPGSLQMGWTNSPPYFCEVTDIIVSLIIRLMAVSFASNGISEPHPLEEYACPPPEVTGSPPPLSDDFSFILKVFVDDFMGGIAVPPHVPHTPFVLWAARACFHGTHAVFPPPDISGHLNGRDSISLSKLAKGDATYTPDKTLVGFRFCGLPGPSRTVGLPESKWRRYRSALDAALAADRHIIPWKTFESLYGKLQHVATCFPLLRAYMTALNTVFKRPSQTVGLGKASILRKTLLRLGPLLDQAHETPAHICQLVPTALPHVYSYFDAAAVGAGGVCLPCTLYVPAILWRIEFPKDIADCVREGSITNSDVEQFAWFVDHCEKAIWVPTGPACLCEHKYSDNSPTVGWDNRKASSANSTAPSDFIQLAAMVSHAERRAPGETTHTSGESNRMADFASRSYEEGYPTTADALFLQEFSHRFPLPPQLGSWQLARVRSEITSVGFSILRRAKGTNGGPGARPGGSGLCLRPELAKILGSPPSSSPISTWNAKGCSWPLLGPSGKASNQLHEFFLGRPSRERFVKSASLWCGRDFRTLASNIHPRSASTNP